MGNRFTIKQKLRLNYLVVPQKRIEHNGVNSL